MTASAFPTSLPDFQVTFPDEAACLAYLESLRWPDGFVCSSCKAKGEPRRIVKRPHVLRCAACKCETSVTAGTVLQDSHSRLVNWFWGAYLLTTQTPGMSALQFQRQLGLNRYATAFLMLHKLRAAMVRPDRDRIGNKGTHVEVDEVLVGGRTRGEGRGKHHKSLVVGAIEVRRGKDKPPRDMHEGAIPLPGRNYAGRLRLCVVPDRGAQTLVQFVDENVLVGSTIVTDGWQGYDKLASMGFDHRPVVLHGDPDMAEKHLPMIHLVFGNLKTWINGTHHGVSKKHLQAYLNEYVFRFNRRFYPFNAFNSILGVGAKTLSPTRRQLYDGAWTHPTQGGCATGVAACG
jgi:transposase-like protein